MRGGFYFRIGCSVMQINGYHHVNILVTDVERSVQFYRDVLGLERIDRSDFSFDGAWFRVGANAELHLAQTSGVVPAGSHHFAIEVDDWDEAVDTIESSSTVFDVPPSTRPDGSPVAFIRDPDGNRIELVYHDSWH